MSDKTEWFHGVLEAEFWAVYRGWRVFVRKSWLGWYWSAIGAEVGRGGLADDRPSAEAAAFAAVDSMVGNE